MQLLNKATRFIENGVSLPLLQSRLNQSQWLSASELKTLQNSKLKALLLHACKNVPFYRPYFQKIDWNAFDAHELTKLPVVDKDLIRAHFDDFLSAGIDQDRLDWKRTSGSSGKPFRVPKSRLSDALEAATQFRAFSMGGEPYRIRDPLLVLRTYVPPPGGPIFHHDWLRNYWYLSPFDINPKNIQIYLDIFEKSKSRFLKGYPSSIYILTNVLKDLGVTPPSQIKTLITSSETLLPLYRKTIESYWNLPVLDWYGQNERTVTASQCSYGTYHNNDEYGLLELNHSNEIIATHLHNFSLPLIRYNTHDVAVPPSQDSNCPCGRGLSIAFSSVSGRSDDVVRKDDGTVASSVNIYTAMESFDLIRQFKLIQKQDLSIQLLVVPSTTLQNEYLDQIRKNLIERLGNLTISIEAVNEIPRDLRTNKIKAIEAQWITQ